MQGSTVLTLTTLAQLDVSAASGIVATRDRLYVIADDETFLAAYTHAGDPVSKIVLGGLLPEDHASRKRHKPDYEALCLLPDGRLLALSSGSRPARMRAALVTLPVGSTPVQTESIDLQPLYAHLEQSIPELNIEGAVVFGERLWLLQRGNGKARFNACIELDLERALATLQADKCLDASALIACRRVALGELHGVALSFTDVTAHPTLGLLFSAAAEQTSNTYDDGLCVGSVVGRLSEQGDVQAAQTVSACSKVEGLCVLPDAAQGVPLRLVCDADDRSVPATLYTATLAR